MTDIAAAPPLPAVNAITKDDIRAALKAGLADFQAAPIYGLFFGLVFSLAGIAIAWALYQGQASYWIFPVAAGFPLIGPFAAVGLYEVSRRLEAGERLSWGAVLSAGFRQKNSQLPFFAVFTIFGFLAWIVLARVIFAVSFGTSSMANVMTSFDIFFTGPGITMLIIGSVVGAALATLLFAISVVGVPLLLDRDIDVVTAMITSFKATVENREAMIFWGVIVAVTTVVAMLPLFLGMILVFPALGHASWHIYRKSVAMPEV
ncbi:MAG: DUF2189 domain-containing protein [Pseudomonadota bacterium]